MNKKLKQILCGVGGLTLCSVLRVPVFAGETIDTSEMDMHKIGVVVYSLQDEQVMAFREYLESYIGTCFPDVEFIYSDSVTDTEAEMKFLQAAIDAGAEGVLSFSSYDLEAEVTLCADNGVYYMRAASSETAENFAKVEDNAYFLGCVGPGNDMEYEAGYEMGKYFAENKVSDRYFILSGGTAFGISMHRIRTQGILDALAESYNVSFTEEELDQLLTSSAAVTLQEGDLTVCVTPGFLDSDAFVDAAKEAYEQNCFEQVLAVVPIADLAETVQGAKLGVIDCYSTQNLQLFEQGSLEYVTGKFSSTIGPSFAAMYNAVTGFAEDFREDGRAFELTQGFWTSDSRSDYEKKYALSFSIALNAYSAEDIASVLKRYNPNATMEDLKELADAYTYEDAAARRGID